MLSFYSATGLPLRVPIVSDLASSASAKSNPEYDPARAFAKERS